MKIDQWIAVGLAAVALTGCGKVLDWRNAEVSGGKVYEEGANTPFSGKVTNVPSEKLLTPRAGWGKAMWSQLNMVHGAGTLCTTSVKEGAPEGDVVCTSPRHPGPIYEVTLEGGTFEGDFHLYDGSKEKRPVVSAHFEDGKLQGKHQVFRLGTDKLLYEASYEAGKLHGTLTVYDQQTGARTFVEHYQDGAKNGESLRYTADGQILTERATYKGGQLDGVREQFNYQTGTKTSEEHYVQGKRRGPSKQWADDGRLTRDVVYLDDFKFIPASAAAEAPSSAAGGSASACVDKWIAAFRKEAGPEAPVRMDVLGEWEQNCREGKLPG